VPPGILTLTNSMTLAPGSSFAAELNGSTAGTGYDQLLLTSGSVTITGANLQTSLGFNPTGSGPLSIITGGTVTGTFAGLANGSQFTVGTFGGTSYLATITYNPTSSVVLSGFQPVPEPAHVLLLAAGAAGAWRLRRRRRTAV
jgi:hypothetical protein